MTTSTTSKQQQLDAIEARMREIKGRLDRLSDDISDNRRFFDYLKAFNQLDDQWNAINRDK